MKILARHVIVVSLNVSFLISVNGQKNERFLRMLESNGVQAMEICSSKLQSKVTPAQLEQAWSRVIGQYGSLVTISFIETSIYKDTLQLERYLCQFKNGSLFIDIYAGKHLEKIEGFVFRLVKYEPPDYVDFSLITETKYSFYKDQLLHQGIVTWPINRPKAMVAILLPGSGNVDADVTVFSNKIFKDISLGLAMNGVASVRFDKVTYLNHSYSPQDLNDEYNWDVNHLISKFTKSDSTLGIVIIGHSLGGLATINLMSRNRNEKISSIILMATPFNSILDLMIYQSIYIKKHTLNIQDSLAYNKIIADAKRAKSLRLLNSDDLLLGYSKKYWASINNSAFVSLASQLKIKTMFLQGERDYQVPYNEYLSWKKMLDNKGNFTFESWPKLNHLFQEGNGLSIPEEYSKTSHVPEYVIKKISSFIEQ